MDNFQAVKTMTKKLKNHLLSATFLEYSITILHYKLSGIVYISAAPSIQFIGGHSLVEKRLILRFIETNLYDNERGCTEV